MTPKSPSVTTAVGVIAAAATVSSSSTRTVSLTSISSTLTTPPCTSNISCPPIDPSSLKNHRRQVKSAAFVHRVPRGGSSESTHHHHMNNDDNPTLHGDVQNKQHHKDKKKKKRSKSSSGNKPSKAKEEDTSTSQNNNTTNDQTPSNHDNDNASTSTILPPEIQHILSQSCHYAVLGVPPSASPTDILKAYRKKCVLTHPDKLPSHLPDKRSAFDKVAKAYDVLGCEKKRAVYDRFGNVDYDLDIDNVPGGAAGGMGSMFGSNDFVRDFFTGTSSAFFGDPFATRRSHPGANGNANPFRRPPRNKDLRYNLEVTLEDLYTGTTKHVAIQQPNPLQPHFPLRKEVEVTLPPGMMSGNSVRISGVVDSIPNCAPADVVFLLSERRHDTFTRRGCDLAMEMKISLGESVGGWRRKVRCLDGKEIVIAPPMGGVVERWKKKKERGESGDGDGVVDVPPLTLSSIESDGNVNNNTTDCETELIQLPSTMIQTGDVHVLKGKGMPRRSASGMVGQQYGDLYIQFVVEMPGGSNNKLNPNRLTDMERMELARLLHKLEGKEDPSIVVKSNNSTTTEGNKYPTEDANILYLEPALASDFGSSHPTENNDHDEHLRHEDDDSHSHGFHTNDLNDFFQRAFGGRTYGSSFGSSGFHYFSSGGRGFGYDAESGEDDHKVECNQM
ncbi:hypothetical protein HJC23_005536 [Cyclotella cryptica]|uniref:J domain-containing protein n=1 Tax=Cyclotella cryptica TaxID=29204 RepID=A0ABD3PXW4_9STRA|eukprot:CCRYP_010628-RA/>CCRYP_010628-RA protein AED:0.00 eAED:0.00 QI:166/-1/1/1/-1/1/1/18/672